ncbi:uncharacterized protein LOC143533939 [Bidens hawaiensis]|uniref:uncharacterized protein LOC143533939 n=1 Tax=Bidens hawaiensis TaxID=980011 RepID=UPI0040497B5B
MVRSPLNIGLVNQTEKQKALSPTLKNPALNSPSGDIKKSSFLLTESDESSFKDLGGGGDDHRIHPGKGKDRDHTLRVASWNVGSLNGKLLELVDVLKRHRVQIACLQETRWKGHRGTECNGYKLWYSGSNEAKNGVGFLVAKKLLTSVVEVIRHNDRILVLRLVLGEVVVAVVCAYAPHAELGDQEKREFWEFLYAIVRDILRDERICIEGDFKGHIGEDNDGFQSDCKVIPGETVVAQHRLLVADIGFRNKLTERARKFRPRIPWGALKDDSLSLFKDKLVSSTLVQLDGDSNQIWEALATKITQVVKETLGVTTGKASGHKESWWWNKIVQDKIRDKQGSFRELMRCTD